MATKHADPAVRIAALDTLQTLLAARYGTRGVELVVSQQHDARYLAVKTGTTAADVITVVSCQTDETHGLVYVVEAFTWIGWETYGSAFLYRRCPTAGEAVAAITGVIRPE